MAPFGGGASGDAAADMPEEEFPADVPGVDGKLAPRTILAVSSSVSGKPSIVSQARVTMDSVAESCHAIGDAFAKGRAAEGLLPGGRGCEVAAPTAVTHAVAIAPSVGDPEILLSDDISSEATTSSL